MLTHLYPPMMHKTTEQAPNAGMKHFGSLVVGLSARWFDSWTQGCSGFAARTKGACTLAMVVRFRGMYHEPSVTQFKEHLVCLLRPGGEILLRWDVLLTAYGVVCKLCCIFPAGLLSAGLLTTGKPTQRLAHT